VVGVLVEPGTVWLECWLKPRTVWLESWLNLGLCGWSAG